MTNLLLSKPCMPFLSPFLMPLPLLRLQGVQKSKKNGVVFSTITTEVAETISSESESDEPIQKPKRGRKRKDEGATPIFSAQSFSFIREYIQERLVLDKPFLSETFADVYEDYLYFFYQKLLTVKGNKEKMEERNLCFEDFKKNPPNMPILITKHKFAQALETLIQTEYPTSDFKKTKGKVVRFFGLGLKKQLNPFSLSDVDLQDMVEKKQDSV